MDIFGAIQLSFLFSFLVKASSIRLNGEEHSFEMRIKYVEPEDKTYRVSYDPISVCPSKSHGESTTADEVRQAVTYLYTPITTRVKNVGYLVVPFEVKTSCFMNFFGQTTKSLIYDTQIPLSKLTEEFSSETLSEIHARLESDSEKSETLTFSPNDEDTYYCSWLKTSHKITRIYRARRTFVNWNLNQSLIDPVVNDSCLLKSKPAHCQLAGDMWLVFKENTVAHCAIAETARISGELYYNKGSPYFTSTFSQFVMTLPNVDIDKNEICILGGYSIKYSTEGHLYRFESESEIKEWLNNAVITNNPNSSPNGRPQGTNVETSTNPNALNPSEQSRKKRSLETECMVSEKLSCLESNPDLKGSQILSEQLVGRDRFNQLVSSQCCTLPSASHQERPHFHIPILKESQGYQKKYSPNQQSPNKLQFHQQSSTPSALLQSQTGSLLQNQSTQPSPLLKQSLPLPLLRELPTASPSREPQPLPGWRIQLPQRTLLQDGTPLQPQEHYSRLRRSTTGAIPTATVLVLPALPQEVLGSDAATTIFNQTYKRVKRETSPELVEYPESQRIAFLENRMKWLASESEYQLNKMSTSGIALSGALKLISCLAERSSKLLARESEDGYAYATLKLKDPAVLVVGKDQAGVRVKRGKSISKVSLPNINSATWCNGALKITVGYPDVNELFTCWLVNERGLCLHETLIGECLIDHPPPEFLIPTYTFGSYDYITEHLVYSNYSMKEPTPFKFDFHDAEIDNSTWSLDAIRHDMSTYITTQRDKDVWAAVNSQLSEVVSNPWYHVILSTLVPLLIIIVILGLVIKLLCAFCK